MTTASTGNTYDPSTKQIFSVYNWTHGVTGTISTYITRNNNAVFYQTDWSGGATGNVATLPNSQFGASTNINYSITGSISVATSSGGGSSGGTGQNIWVVDQGNNRVEEFSTGGTYESTFGSYGSGGAGHFGSPIPDVVDSNGNVWVADGAGYSQELEEFSPSGSYESEFHMGSVGDAAGIAINSGGQFFISDAYANNIEEFSATGTYMNTIGSTGSTNGKFGSNGPTGIAFDSGGNMWVADNGNNRVEKFVASGTTYVYSNKFAEPNGVVGIAFDSGGNMWMGNYNVDEYSPSGTTYAYKSTFTNGGEFSNANNLAIDSGGNIWVSDWRNNNVVELSATGTPEQTIGSYGSSTGQFNAPYGIAIY